MTIDLRRYLPALAVGGAQAPSLDPAAELRRAKAGAETAARLGAGVSLLENALAGGVAGLAALGKTRQALGSDGALGPLLDELQTAGQAEEEIQLRRSARTSAFVALKQIARLPLPLPQKTALGRSLVERALGGGLIRAEERATVEAALLSESVLQETRQALAGTAEPGAAKALVDEAKQQGLLVPHDTALLERLAAERAPIEAVRHRARLAWKEQDDLSAYGRGELPEPLGEKSFPLLYGAQRAPDAWARYQAARHEAEALLLIRGKTADEIETARSPWTGEPAIFDAALRRDAEARRRDPAGYLLANAVGLKQALNEIESAGERQALLWAKQSELGLAERERSPWPLTEEERLADAWDAIPAGHGGRNERLGFFEKHLLGLPAEQRPAAIARLVRQGIVDGTEAELAQLVAELEAGRINPARRLAAGLGIRTGAGKGPRSGSLSQLREKPGPTQELRSGHTPSPLLTPAKHILRTWPPGSPWGPTAEETTKALERLWDSLSELLTIDRAAPSPEIAPLVDVLPPQKPEPQRDFDIEEAREIAEGLFGPGLEPVDLGPVFTITGFTIEDFGSEWIKEVFPDLSESLPQITILETSPGSPKTRALNHRIARILKDSIYRATQVMPTSTKIWYGSYAERKHMGELYLQGKDSKGVLGSSYPDISIELERGKDLPAYSFEVPVTKNCKIHVNTIDTRAHWRPTTRENDAGIRILRNMETCDVLILIPKLKKGVTLNEVALRELFDRVATEMAKPTWEQKWHEQNWGQRFEFFKHGP